MLILTLKLNERKMKWEADIVEEVIKWHNTRKFDQ